MNRETKASLIDHYRNGCPLLRTFHDRAQALYSPDAHEYPDGSFGFDKYYADGKTDVDAAYFTNPEDWRLATPEDLAKFPSYKGSVEQPWGIQELAYKGREPLKGSTEEPLTPNTDLMPCPFCGGDAYEGQKAIHGGLAHYYVRCIPCTVEMRDDRRDKVRAEWNKRSASPLEHETKAGEFDLLKSIETLNRIAKDCMSEDFSRWHAEPLLRIAKYLDGLRSRLLPSNPESPPNEWIPLNGKPDIDCWLTDGSNVFFSPKGSYVPMTAVSHYLPIAKPSPPTSKD